jgi:hypothetical protein
MGGEGGGQGGGGGDMWGSSSEVAYTPDSDDAKAELAGGMWVSSTYTTKEVTKSFVVYLTVSAPSDATNVFQVTLNDNAPAASGKTATATTVAFTSATAAFTDGRDGTYVEPSISGGWTFLGWATNPNAKTAEYADMAAINAGVSTTTTLFGVWQAPEIYVDATDGNWVINGVKTTTPVTGADGKDGTNGTNGTNGVGIQSITSSLSADGESTEVTVTYTNGQTEKFTVANGKDGATGATGATGAAGTNGTNGVDGKDASASGSTAGLVLAIIALVIAVAGAGAIVFLIIKKKN